jgi:alpha-L-fucosidase 2
MKMLCFFLLVLIPNFLLAQDNAPSTGSEFIVNQDVTWTTLGKNENDSMPIGNGDLAANVWTEQNGDLVMLLAKPDAWSQVGQLLKLGRVRIQLTPNPFVGGTGFTQTLKLETGTIEIKSGNNVLDLWVDANAPVMHIEAHLDQPATLQAKVELWRNTTHPFQPPVPDNGEFFEFGTHPVPVEIQADTVFPAKPNRITFCHFNASSVYPLVLQQEHLESLLSKYPDPLLNRCFGATISGPGLVSSDDHTLKSASSSLDLRCDICALTQAPAASPQVWQASIVSLANKVNPVDLDRARQAHQLWWKNFWNRSWINVTGDADALKVSQSYAMQRWMMACSSRGAQPVKFNGGLFTVGHELPEGKQSSGWGDHGPDFRLWGGCFWNQNNRLLYWPLIATGDEDLLKPWFDMYVKALPLATDRTQLYYHHDGAAFVETTYFWGLPNVHDFGWDNTGNVIQSGYMRYHIQGTLEVISQMLDSYAVTQNAAFAQSSLVPFATAILAYYENHWPRTADGKINMTPSQSIETYHEATNPTPDIAGLMSVLPRMLALPMNLTTPEQRDAWKKMLQDLPPIAVGKTAKGKLPPRGVGDPDGTPTILPAEKYGDTANGENPQLYVSFPYRLYGVGKPNLDLALKTYAARLNHGDTCWGQDGTEAAVLGVTADAKKAVIDEFTHEYGGQRFPWFWASENDWTPDLDNGGSGMITLQEMLMQCDGRRIQLLTAWPAGWTADFKLHAPYQTTVQGHVENGKLSQLQVVPASRARDVVVCPVAPSGT